jgi:viroplasmin and RNaseH domain-containing protein
MEKKKKWFYVVWIGRRTGIFKTWSECQEQINGFNGAKFKKFPKKEIAEKALKEGWHKYIGEGSKPLKKEKKKVDQKPYEKVDLISFNIEEVITHINEYFDERSKEYIKSRI